MLHLSKIMVLNAVQTGFTTSVSLESDSFLWAARHPLPGSIPVTGLCCPPTLTFHFSWCGPPAPGPRTVTLLPGTPLPSPAPPSDSATLGHASVVLASSPMPFSLPTLVIVGMLSFSGCVCPTRLEAPVRVNAGVCTAPNPGRMLTHCAHERMVTNEY